MFPAGNTLDIDNRFNPTKPTFLTVGDALRQGTALLAEAPIGGPRLTAELLLMHALHVERSYLYAHPEQPLREVEWIHYGRYLHERMRGKPAQYITGHQEFYGRDFHVTPDVLIPRPETEHLVEAALGIPARRIVDVGCGSGAIAITLALEKDAVVTGCDSSLAALRVSAENGRRLEAKVSFAASDLLSAIAPESVDLVVSNPPYVAESTRASLQREVRDWEPALALFAGPDGLDIYRRLIPQAARALRPGGHLALELGFNSLEPVRGLLTDWREIQVIDDLAGIPRVIVCRK